MLAIVWKLAEIFIEIRNLCRRKRSRVPPKPRSGFVKSEDNQKPFPFGLFFEASICKTA